VRVILAKKLVVPGDTWPVCDIGLGLFLHLDRWACSLGRRGASCRSERALGSAHDGRADWNRSGRHHDGMTGNHGPITGLCFCFPGSRYRRIRDCSRPSVAKAHWRRVAVALSGVASLLLGILMIALPIAGALSIARWIGAYGFVFGTLLIALGFRLRAWARLSPDVQYQRAQPLRLDDRRPISLGRPADR
jgi:hypothetical protein